MQRLLPCAVLCLACGFPAAAATDVYELQQAYALHNKFNKVTPGKIQVTVSQRFIDFTPEQSFDKFTVTISGAGGFSKQFETDTPSVNISELDLPYEGEYQYQIQAVKYLVEVKDTINNGRPEDATGYISRVAVASGQFKNQWGQFATYSSKSEKELERLEAAAKVKSHE